MPTVVKSQCANSHEGYRLKVWFHIWRLKEMALYPSPFAKQMKAWPTQVWTVVGRGKGNQQVQCPWAVRAEKLLPPQAVGNIARQVVRSYAADTGTWKELCVAKKRHSNCLGPVLGWCLPLAEPVGLEARAGAQWSIPSRSASQGAKEGWRTHLEGQPDHPPQSSLALLFLCLQTTVSHHLTNMFHTLMWLSEIYKNEGS